MRRFSQRSYLVTLNEINITPLLDLAFVLLIIFIITTPLLEQGVELQLPKGGSPDRPMTKEDFRTLELGRGFYQYEGRKLDYAQLGQMLAYERQRNPGVIILIRADRATVYQDVFAVVDLCANLNLGFSLRSEPVDTP
jgi:biopolymer transport protein ExbD